MSGRKYSQVELAAQVREALRCRLAAEQALGVAEIMAGTLAEAAQTVEALQDAATSVRETLASLHHEIASMQKSFSEAYLMRLDPSEVRARRERVNNLRGRLDAVVRNCREGCGASGVRVEAARLVEQVAQERTALLPWLGEEYDAFATGAVSALAETDREIRTTGSAAIAASRILALGEDLDRMTARVTTRREQDADRRYIAEALLRVCREDLGFAAKILPQKAPIDDLVIEVDTFAYGLLQFHLLLDSTIRSQSELTEASCPIHFGAIENRLRSLGVLSNFRYEGDQRPVVIERDAKPTPDEVRAAEVRRV
jgi:hypothetical protein